MSAARCRISRWKVPNTSGGSCRLRRSFADQQRKGAVNRREATRGRRDHKDALVHKEAHGGGGALDAGFSKVVTRPCVRVAQDRPHDRIEDADRHRQALDHPPPHSKGEGDVSSGMLALDTAAKPWAYREVGAALAAGQVGKQAAHERLKAHEGRWNRLPRQEDEQAARDRLHVDQRQAAQQARERSVPHRPGQERQQQIVLGGRGRCARAARRKKPRSADGPWRGAMQGVPPADAPAGRRRGRLQQGRAATG